MTRMSIFRAAVILFVLGAIVSGIAGISLPLDHENASSRRHSLPARYHNPEKSSVSHTSREKHERDGNNRIHGRHEFQRSRPVTPAGTRIPYDTLLRNSRSRYATRGRRGNSYDDGLFEPAANETSSSGHSGIGRGSSHLQVANGGDGKFIESGISRSMSTTKTYGSSGDAKEGSGEPEKLTAVAVAKYSSTRAVAYAGYHHHNVEYNPTRTRGRIGWGYELDASTEMPSYTKHHAGRRVCTRQTPNSIANYHRSAQHRLVYTELTASTFLCCPGWSQVSRASYGCNRPTCAARCLNGGVCGPHGRCNCPKGYTGTQCQTDIDECITEKPCGQICVNVPGRFECHCRYGFHLQPDGQSCQKNGSDGTAFEAHDLENDYDYTSSTTTELPKQTTPSSLDTENEVDEGNVDQDYEIISKLLANLEKQIAKSRKRDSEVSEMSTKTTHAIQGVAAIRRAVNNVQLMQQEIHDIRGKVKQFELENQKLRHLTNRVADLESRLKLRCRNSING